MQPEYKVTKNCKHRDRACRKCGFPVKINRKYTIDPERFAEDGLPYIYHADCWRQLTKRK